jgi:hypothetical protein
MPKSSRPPDSKSSVAACSASSTGLCHGSTITAVPSRRSSRAGAQPGQQIEGRGDLAKAGEMVLDDEGAVKAERLGLDVVIDEVSKAFGAVELAAASRAAALPNRPNRIGVFLLNRFAIQ